MGLYDETVAYWSKDGSILDAVDAVGFGITNPAAVGSSIAVGVDQRVEYVKEKAAEAAGYLQGKLVKGVVIVGVAYLAFVFVKSYASTKAAGFAK